MSLRLERLGVVLAQEGEDVVLADQRRAVHEAEYWDRVGADGRTQGRSRLSLDRNLPDDVVDSELGQPLPHAPGGGAPFGLEELEHRTHPLAPATTSRSESSCFSRLPQTCSQSEKTLSSAIE